MRLSVYSYNRSTKSRLWKRFRGLPILTILLLFSMTLQGCNIGLIMGYLIGGPPSVDPEFDLTTNLSMTDKGIKVAVICTAPKNMKLEYTEIDTSLMKAVAARLYEHNIKVIDPEKITAWLDEHPEWDKPQELGKDLDATYVIYIDLSKFSLYEKGAQDLYRGRAEAMISVIEMDDEGEGEKIFTKSILSQYPYAISRSTQDISYTKFKREYRAHLSDIIGRLFYEQYNGDDFDAAT